MRSLVSSNAYMLVYRAVGYGEAAALSEVGALPAELQAVVSEQAAAFMDTCDTYERQSKAMEAQVGWEPGRSSSSEGYGVHASPFPAGMYQPQTAGSHPQAMRRIGESMSQFLCRTAFIVQPVPNCLLEVEIWCVFPGMCRWRPGGAPCAAFCQSCRRAPPPPLPPQRQHQLRPGTPLAPTARAPRL